MRIRLVAIGEKMPGWVGTAWSEYARRLGGAVNLELVEVPADKRGRTADIARVRKEEGERLLKAVPDRSRIIALDVGGRQWSTLELARTMGDWMQDGRDVALLVGGPEGLDSACLKAAERRWSLSALTFPHPLVRVIVAEQVYRAWSVIEGHPYHRA